MVNLESIMPFRAAGGRRRRSHCAFPLRAGALGEFATSLEVSCESCVVGIRFFLTFVRAFADRVQREDGSGQEGGFYVTVGPSD